MKVKYLLTLLVVAATAMFTSCDEGSDHFLDEVKLSSSYVAIDMNGGTTNVTMTTTDSYTISDVPEWLTVSPMNGAAGETKLSFTAGSTLDGRNCEIKINCAGKTQLVSVIQGLATIPKATCAEVNSGIEGKNYLVSGTVTKIANTSYGNFYINDGTGELYIYGTVDETGSYNWSKFDIEVGDEVTVQGPLAIYNGTYELKDATFVECKKSLIKVESLDPEDGTIPTEGGDLTVNLSCKGNGIFAEVPADAQEWLSIKSISGNTVVFHAIANEKAPRATTLIFKTTDGKKEYTAETSITQSGAAGKTPELPMTVEEAIAAANAGISYSVYVKGVVSKVLSGGYNAEKGYASFWISADGNYNDDLSLDFEVYQGNWLGGASWTENNAQIEEGAEVMIYGPLALYKGTAETQGKGVAYVYSVNGVQSDANGIGTLNTPFDAVGGVKAANAKVGVKVYVEGIVSELVKGGFDANYGNGSFFISTDGVKHSDANLDFEAYQVNYLGGEKWVEGTDPQMAVGDNVVIYGPLTVYGTTAETQGKGAAYVYKHNGVSK